MDSSFDNGNRAIALAYRLDASGSQVLQAELGTQHSLKHCSNGVDFVVGAHRVCSYSNRAVCYDGVVLRK